MGGMTEPRLRVLSLGAGVQSTTLALMINHGHLPPVDCAMFADTEGEPRKVYAHLKWLRAHVAYPIHTVSAGNLWKSASTLRKVRDANRFYLKTSLPVFTATNDERGRGKRFCTSDFKIDPLNRALRKMLGVKSVRRSSGVLVEMLLGITTDEAQRMKPSEQHWIEKQFPLVDVFNMDRRDCIEWCERRGYQTPPRSACTFCPNHDDGFWLDMEPDEFADVCGKERELQAAYAATGSLTSVPYFHRSCVPLDQVTFARPVPGMKQRGLPFGEECEGVCGV